MAKIEGGYYIKARCIQESKIASAPPHVREIWDWLIKEANHCDTKVCKRGQLVRTFEDIRDGLAWYVGWRKNRYTKDHCEKAMKWLRKEEMIATTKTTRGMVITVLKYDLYQDPSNYESNKESCTRATEVQQTSDTINKNEKNEKNKELNNTSRFAPPTLEEVKKYCTERNNGVNSEKWHNFYSAKGWMVGKNKMKDWKAAVRTWEEKKEKSYTERELPKIEEPTEEQRKKNLEALAKLKMGFNKKI